MNNKMKILLKFNFLILYLFHLNTQIKGFKSKELKAEIERVAKIVGLGNNLNKKSKDLSGGMKRRLSLGMSLIGDSKIILLDEPTSGLDPFNRRSLWDMIRNFKKDRTVLLTTHFMEEADALSDRIAIMA
jgi:ATP-binding cassette subfamily A (ABC1) protein 3